MVVVVVVVVTVAVVVVVVFILSRMSLLRGNQDENFGVVGRTVTDDLTPERFHYRLPFFAKPTNLSQTAYISDGNSTEVMQQEIDYAHAYGIDYWALCT